MGHGENNTDERGDDSKLEQRLKYLFPTQYDVGVDYNGFAPSPLTLKTDRKRLYFSDFKERLLRFNGTVAILAVFIMNSQNICKKTQRIAISIVVLTSSLACLSSVQE